MKRLFLHLFLLSCTKKEPHIPPISNFEIEKYLGTWHEIARTDNSFEKGCTDVQAVYSNRLDGGIDVINSCFVNGKKRTAKGVAYFVDGRKNVGELKVSFFRPFYGTYRVIYIDEGYQNAIVYGGSPAFVWILSRSSTIHNSTLQNLLDKIKNFNLDEKNLIIKSS